MRILVGEDEKKLAAFIKKVLEREKYAVDVVFDGIETGIPKAEGPRLKNFPEARVRVPGLLTFSKK
jgi:DNA-binding response OmpR family regulator